jgi:hypothetical protein
LLADRVTRPARSSFVNCWTSWDVHRFAPHAA